VPTVAAGATFWPVVHVLNLRYVALVNRPLVGSMAGVIWNVYMSSVINKGSHAMRRATVRLDTTTEPSLLVR
jgi:hypothetical protein